MKVGLSLKITLIIVLFLKKPEEGIELRREDAEPIYDRHLNMALSEA